MNTKTITLGGEHITVTRFDTDDYKIFFENEHRTVRGSMLDIIKEFAEWQMCEFQEDPAVYFDYEDIAICNPWYEQTGRFPLSDYEASAYYGLENLLKFIMDACEFLRPDNEEVIE